MGDMLVGNAIATCNIKSLGSALHTLQDGYAHPPGPLGPLLHVITGPLYDWPGGASGAAAAGATRAALQAFNVCHAARGARRASLFRNDHVKEQEMRSLVRLLPSRRDYSRLTVWMFCLAWLIGNISLIVGLNGSGGEVPAICGFVIACGTWWGAYRLGGTKTRVGSAVGLLAIGIWSVNLLGAMVFAFHHYVADFFFWAIAIALVVLIIATALSNIPDRVGES
jgi:hypothetical protein